MRALIDDSQAYVNNIRYVVSCYRCEYAKQNYKPVDELPARC